MMNPSTSILRTVFGLVFSVSGFLLGREAYDRLISLHVSSEYWQFILLLGVPIVGAIIGIALAPLGQSFFESQFALIEGAVENLEPAQVAGGAVGLAGGLVIAFLVKSILFEFVTLAGTAGSTVAIVVYVIVSIYAAALGARIGAKLRIVPIRSALNTGIPKVLDTSVIIDGRIVDLIEKSFIEGAVIVPRFVLRELQALSDSSDSLKRTRGRRGLDALARLQLRGSITVEERDYEELPPGSVDAKLVRLCRDLGGKLLTNDYGLDRIAHVDGIRVLNLNELTDALKPIVVPGEEFGLHVIREGREQHQGVGYLDDGTMVVVEQGRIHMGEHIDVVVTSILQTGTGRMIFVKPKREVA